MPVVASAPRVAEPVHEHVPRDDAIGDAPFARCHDARIDEHLRAHLIGGRELVASTGIARRMAIQREILADELRGIDRRNDVIVGALDCEQRHWQRSWRRPGASVARNGGDIGVGTVLQYVERSEP